MNRHDIATRLMLSSETFEGSNCWGWSGRCRKDDGRPVAGRIYAYRVIYELLRGAIPQDAVAHHRCEHPWCINPWHIEVMPRGDHLKEHDLVGDWGQRDKTHCPAGHPYTEANTYRWRNERHCRACRSAAKARFNQRQTKEI